MKEVLVQMALGLFLLAGSGDSLTYTIDAESDPSSVVSDYFLSVALDTTNVSTIDITDARLAKMVQHLAPMHFRIGGTQADDAIFEDDSKAGMMRSEDNNGFAATLTASYWLKIHEFANKANVRLLFDLNSLLRNDDGSWNSENAEAMIKFSKQNDIDLDWELGNEPDLYHAIYNKQVSADQLGNDYKNLRALLDQDGYESSLLVGPSMFDVGSNDDTRTYLKNYLAVASSSIHAVTWHQYYFSGRDATEDMFLNPATFNYLEQRIRVVTDIVGSANKVWLGETSSAYNGGAPNMSNRFLASFLWLDKLGLGAKLGLDVIIRQTIWGYNYPLLDIDYSPNPDWWLSILYKRIVGTKVIPMTNDGEDSRTVRLYAHCAQQNELWDGTAVVVFGLNIANDTASYSLAGLKSDDDVYVYELTAEDSLLSQTVRLNGDVLSLTEDLELPELKPKVIKGSDTFKMSPYSIAFWVFSGTNVKACQ